MEKKLLTLRIIFELIYYVNAQFYLIPILQSPSTSYNLITTNNYNQYQTSPNDGNNLGPEYIYSEENEVIDNSTQNEIWLDDVGYEENLLDGLDTPDILLDELSSDTRTSCPKCDCGLRFRHRIVGGMYAEKYEFPWMTLVRYSNMFICGGSLINDRYVVTAAHCIQRKDPKLYQVKFHEHDRYSTTDTDYILKNVIKVMAHKNYQGSNNNNDIGLLKISEPINFTGNLPRPICLPDLNEVLVGKTVVAAGWGTTREDGATSGILKKVYLPVISNNECKKRYGSQIATEHICAGKKSGGEDACQGDSGGPLMYLKGKKLQLIGITSWGIGCARPNTPGVYSRVTSHLQWIADNTKDACTCT